MRIAYNRPDSQWTKNHRLEADEGREGPTTLPHHQEACLFTSWNVGVSDTRSRHY